MKGLFFSVVVLLSVGCASTRGVNQPFVKAKQISSAENLPTSGEKKTPKSQPSLVKRMSFESAKPKTSASKNPNDVIRNANEEAKRNPERDGFFNSSMVFDWESNFLYQIYTSPLRVTDISFEPSERVISISGGDTTRWLVAQTSSGSGLDETAHIIIKPFRAQLQTNLIIMTDRRTYHLEIHSLSDGNYMASVSWNFPRPLMISLEPRRNEEEEGDPLESLAKTTLNFGYHFVASKKPSWMPSRVFDDGKKTFIEFPEGVKSREMPGLFVLSDTGDSEIINYRSFGNYLIVDRLLDVVELRLGTVVAEVVGIERLL